MKARKKCGNEGKETDVGVHLKISCLALQISETTTIDGDDKKTKVVSKTDTKDTWLADC